MAPEFVGAGLLGAAIADALQFVEEGDAVAIGALIGILRREDAGKDARSQHGRGEARALLVGPVDDLDRRVGLVALLVQRAHRLRARRARPSTPSNLPPVGWVSRCEPMAIGRQRCSGRAGTANMLPTSSTVTVQPSASHWALNQSRTFLSSSESVRRLMPPFAVPPNLAVSIRLSHRRCGLMVRLVSMVSAFWKDGRREGRGSLPDEAGEGGPTKSGRMGCGQLAPPYTEEAP